MSLVVFTGFPCSGKTTLSKYLQPWFVRFSSDEMREMLYGEDYIAFRNSSDYVPRNRLMYEMMSYMKRNLLSTGYNVVVDSSASGNPGRRSALELDLDVDRFLIHLNVNKDILMQRNLAKGRSAEFIDRWYEIWQPIDKDLLPYTVTFQNNSQQDLKIIKEFFDDTFLS